MSDNLEQTIDEKEIALAQIEVSFAQQQMNRKSFALRRRQLTADLNKVNANDEAARIAMEDLQSKIEVINSDLTNLQKQLK